MADPWAFLVERNSATIAIIIMLASTIAIACVDNTLAFADCKFAAVQVSSRHIALESAN